jgi:hypothetical protein
LILAGFGFRATGLSAEGLSEDELNKLNAVADYRANGLTGANGEHPMLMKGLQAATIIIAERWNNSSFVASRPGSRIAPETALRLPGAIFGALSTLLIFLIAAELFGVEVALIAAALWAFDPTAIGLNRVAKEDTFLLRMCSGCAGSASPKAPIRIRISTTGPLPLATERWWRRSMCRTFSRSAFVTTGCFSNCRKLAGAWARNGCWYSSRLWGWCF